MKSLIIMAIAGLFAAMPQDQVPAKPTANDFEIVSDNVVDGMRNIQATPSPLVCAKRIDLVVDASTEVIQSVTIYRGCPGNGKAVASLLKGMTVDDAIARLEGIDCANRGTSCTDQLARILKKCFNK